MLKYKILNEDLRSPFQDFQFEIGEEYVCYNFDTSEKECAPGFYATDIEGIIYSFRPGKRVFLAEVGGKEKKFDEFKHRFETQKLVREIKYPELKELLKNAPVDYNLLEACFPINPFLVERENKIPNEQEIQWLRKWGSVGDSVWGSVGDSVGGSVGGSVANSVWAYISSLFPGIKKWEHTEHEEGVNPFQPAINLWKAGLAPSFDGETWRLHAGENAEIVYTTKGGK